MPETARRRILIVEDNESVGRMLAFRLQAAGYDTHHELRGRPALAYAAAHRADLVVLDLLLPDISGLEVSRELRKLYNKWDVPILMLTALAQPVDELRGFASGADAYMTKPYEAQELIQTVAFLLGDEQATKSA